MTKSEVSVPGQKMQRVKLVTVSQPQTLYTLCIEHMNDCNGRTLRLILEMNPWLRDPRRLHTGQKVRMPMEGGVLGSGPNK